MGSYLSRRMIHPMSETIIKFVSLFEFEKIDDCFCSDPPTYITSNIVVTDI